MTTTGQRQSCVIDWLISYVIYPPTIGSTQTPHIRVTHNMLYNYQRGSHKLSWFPYLLWKVIRESADELPFIAKCSRPIHIPRAGASSF